MLKRNHNIADKLMKYQESIQQAHKQAKGLTAGLQQMKTVKPTPKNITPNIPDMDHVPKQAKPTVQKLEASKNNLHELLSGMYNNIQPGEVVYNGDQYDPDNNSNSKLIGEGLYDFGRQKGNRYETNVSGNYSINNNYY